PPEDRHVPGVPVRQGDADPRRGPGQHVRLRRLATAGVRGQGVVDHRPDAAVRGRRGEPSPGRIVVLRPRRAGPVVAHEEITREVRATVQRWLDGTVAADADTLDTLLMPDYTFTH